MLHCTVTVMTEQWQHGVAAQGVGNATAVVAVEVVVVADDAELCVHIVMF